jgi:SAM-dependent methyltransferase
MDAYGKKVSMNQPKVDNHLTSYDIESNVEGFHWWFVVRRKLLRSVLSSIKVPQNRIALEVGCGTGANLRVLESAGVFGIGLDQSLYALNLIKKKEHSPLLAGDLNYLPMKTKSLGLIIAMDVFEHLDHDENGMSECYRVLNHGGILVLTVPAFKFLWGVQDDVTGHKRRYTMKEIKVKLRQGGFGIQRSSFFNFFLFFPILFARRIIGFLNLRIESENKMNHPFINNILKRIFSLEPYLLRYFSFPFGVSILCVARKGD